MTTHHQRRRLVVAAVCILAALGMAPGTAVAGESAAATPPALGRVFLTPEQRRMLDAQRSNPASQGDSTLPRDLLPARTVAGRRVVLNGVVRRGDRGPVVWINGREADAAALSHGGLQMRDGPDVQNRVTLKSRDDGAVARLKPGQAWDPVSGHVTDCVQCGAPPTPAVPPGPPAASAKPADAPAPAVAVAVTTPPAGGGQPGAAVNRQSP